MADKKEVLRDIFIGGAVVAAGYGVYKLIQRLGRSGGTPDVNLKFVTEVLNSLVAKLRLQPTKAGETGKIDRHRAFFIYRRARDLGLANSKLREESGLTTLKSRVESEHAQVEKFVKDKIGTAKARGPLFGGVGDFAPAHLDLGTLLSQRSSEPTTTLQEAVNAATPNEVQARALRALDERRMRVIGFAWRAAALEGDLWESSADARSATLRADDLLELIDRRLRTVERLQYTASAAVRPDGLGTSAAKRQWLRPTSPTGTDTISWIDMQLRTFELPSVPADQFTKFLRGALEEDPSNPRFFQDPRINWYLNLATKECDWNSWPGTQIPERVVPFTDPTDPTAQPVLVTAERIWIRHAPETTNPSQEDRPGYGWMMRPVGDFQPADILDEMFQNRLTDWRLRSWLNSDCLLSALHLEALRHALLRREKKDDLFNALIERFSLALDDYFEVRTVARVENGIMRAGRTDYFENSSLPYDDLQIGDQILVESDINNLIMSVFSATWDYPTLLVTDVDSDTEGDAGIGMLDRIRVQGFMTADHTYGGLQLLLAKRMDAALGAIRQHIVQKIKEREAANSASPPPLFPLGPLRTTNWGAGFAFTRDDIFEQNRTILHLWNPYGDVWDAPGPWWVVINMINPLWRGAFVDILASELVKRLPNAVARVSAGALICSKHNQEIPIRQGFQDPPGTGTDNPHGHVLVPLFQPLGGWLNYFRDKATNPTERWPTRLDPVLAEPHWFFPEAATNTVRVIRARNRPRS